MDPLSFIIPMIFNILGGAFNKGSDGDYTETRARTTQTTPPRGYQSPMLGLLDNLMSSGLLGNLGRLQNAGYPAGMSNKGLVNLPSILSLIQSMTPELMEGATSSRIKRKDETEKKSSEKKVVK